MRREEELLRKSCERCEEGNFDTCECKSNCPVYALYCIAKKQNKVFYYK